MGSLQKSKEQGLTTPLQTTDLPYFQKLNKKATEAPTVLDFSSPHWIDPICQTLTNHENLLIILGLNPAIELYAGDQRIPSVKWKQCLSAAACLCAATTGACPHLRSPVNQAWWFLPSPFPSLLFFPFPTFALCMWCLGLNPGSCTWQTWTLSQIFFHQKLLLFCQTFQPQHRRQTPETHCSHNLKYYHFPSPSCASTYFSKPLSLSTGNGMCFLSFSCLAH